MIKYLRVGERPLHGQVAVTWINQVPPTSILIANDEIVENEIAKMALKMIKPAGINLAIRSVDDRAKLLNGPRMEELQVFVIMRTIQNALRLMRRTTGIQRINISGARKKEGNRLVGAAVYVDGDGIETIEKLVEEVGSVEFQMVPADTPKSAKNIL